MPLSIEQRVIPISPSSIKPGSILEISYRKKDGNVGNYLIMVVDAYRKTERAREPQLHGYLISEMTESEFITFMVSINCPILVDPMNEEIKLVDLSNTEAYQAMRILSTYTSRPYRTFNMSSIISALETVINTPDELDTLLNTPVLISDKNSKRIILQALYDGDLETLRNVPEIKSILRGEQKDEIPETKQAREESERELKESRNKISLRQLLNSITRIFRR